MKWETVVTFSSPSAKSFAFPVESGRTMELAISQFWSSGLGSNEITVADFEVFLINHLLSSRAELIPHMDSELSML